MECACCLLKINSCHWHWVRFGKSFPSPVAGYSLSPVIFIPSSVCVCVCVFVTDPHCVRGKRPQGEGWKHVAGALKMLIKSKAIMASKIHDGWAGSHFLVLKEEGLGLEFYPKFLDF